MSKRDEVTNWLKVNYNSEVKTYKDFRDKHPDCHGYTEGDTATYPSGFQNGSIAQKAKRYALAQDSAGNKSTSPDWQPAHPSFARKVDGKWKIKTLTSGSAGAGGRAIKVHASDFEGFDADDSW